MSAIHSQTNADVQRIWKIFFEAYTEQFDDADPDADANASLAGAVAVWNAGRQSGPSDDAKETAAKDLRVALPYLRFAIKKASENGTAKLGILCEKEDGSGKVECKFDTSILDAVALVIDLPPQTDEDDNAARARAFLDQHGLSSPAATDGIAR